MAHGCQEVGLGLAGRLSLRTRSLGIRDGSPEDLLLRFALGHVAGDSENEVGVVGRELGRVDGGQRAVEVVDRLDEVAGEALQREVFGGLDLALCALLQVAVVGDGAEVFVL